MRQPIDFDQTELDELAKQATELNDWLEERLGSSTIPQKLTTVTTFVLFSGLLVFLDKAAPASTCWMGGCVSL